MPPAEGRSEAEAQTQGGGEVIAQEEVSLEEFDGEWTCSACPVQAEGMVDGHSWYFRSRGEHWEFYVAEPGHMGYQVGLEGIPGWGIDREWGSWPEAGWMPFKTARRLIRLCVARWRRGELARA